MPFIHLDSVQPYHDAYLSAIGRALAVCQHFEDCARHVATVYAITDEMCSNDPVDSLGATERDRLRAIAHRLRASPLGQCLQQLGETSDFRSDRFSMVDCGRCARNWLAHESAALLDSEQHSADAAMDQLRSLRDKVAALCNADAVVSVASYEICEREPAPRPYAESYGERLQEWVLRPVASWLCAAG